MSQLTRRERARAAEARAVALQAHVLRTTPVRRAQRGRWSAVQRAGAMWLVGVAVVLALAATLVHVAEVRFPAGLERLAPRVGD